MADGKGRTALVTGATDGVGRVVAKQLGKDGRRVLLHGRNRERGEALVREIEQAGGKASFLAADLSSLAEVRGLAEAVKKTTDRLELLINNAGIGTMGAAPGRLTSKDGHELRFAVNYLAGFLLTNLLMPMLKASKPSRIVNVASAGQQAIDFDDVMLTKHYSGSTAYRQSKLAQIMFTVDLADELKGTGVIANALHPSTYMNTTMVRQSGVTPISKVETGA
jgi:NAD(P)-dependent dehydrogenase (short-subunit alcohol dehydrogenase family)